MAVTYRYTVRPVKESGHLLIEFLDLPENKDFVKQLIRALQPVNIQVVNYEDLWMIDEIVLNVSSDVGTFAIYRDAEDYYYVTANDNPGAIPILDTILIANSLFVKE